jgi:hypothetical protein
VVVGHAQGLYLQPDSSIPLVAVRGNPAENNTSLLGTWRVGETLPWWNIALEQLPGIPEGLFNVPSSELRMAFVDSYGQVTSGTGTFRVENYYPGQVLYQLSPADVAVARTSSAVVWVNNAEAYELGKWTVSP